MPRPLRPPIENGLYHVMSRGNRRGEIYRDDVDCLYFLDVVAKVVERLDWRVSGYCLMTNHYHLVLCTPLGDISRGMQRLNSMYAQWFNWRYGLDGHLFQGRFHSEDVVTQSHFVELTRYVVLNPVRAGIAEHPASYTWSSYRAAIGIESGPGFFRRDAILEEFGPGVEQAEAGYASFVKAGLDEALRARSSYVRGQTPDVGVGAMAGVTRSRTFRGNAPPANGRGVTRAGRRC
jgi:REP element-mobilizing transposase RayT